MVGKQTDIPYDCKDTPEGLDRLCDIVKSFIASSGVNKDLIINLNLNISGRVNPQSGYSYSRFNFGERPLSDVLTEKTGVHCCIENDTRAMALGEYMCGNCRGERNVIFVNVGWGLGIGLIIDRKIYTGNPDLPESSDTWWRATMK